MCSSKDRTFSCIDVRVKDGLVPRSDYDLNRGIPSVEQMDSSSAISTESIPTQFVFSGGHRRQ